MVRNRNLVGKKTPQKEENKGRISARRIPQPVTTSSPSRTSTTSSFSSNVTSTFASDVSPKSPAVRKSKRQAGQLMMTPKTTTPTAAARANRLFQLMITPKPELGHLSEKNYAASFDMVSSDRKLRKHGRGPKENKAANYASNYRNPKLTNPIGLRRNDLLSRGFH